MWYSFLSAEDLDIKGIVVVEVSSVLDLKALRAYLEVSMPQTRQQH